MRLPRLRTAIIGVVVALPIMGCGYRVAALVLTMWEWHREVAPFRALGARVVASGGDDFGRMAGREGVRAIHFRDNVGDAELAALAERMGRFPNLATIVLEGSSVTDAGIAHLKGLKGLENLILRDTGVTEVGKANLRRALPKLKGL
jgi:hypothetical protein